MNVPDEEEEYESGFSFEGLTGIEDEDQKQIEKSTGGKITATLADFPVDE